MPLVDAGFRDDEGRADLNLLLGYGPTVEVVVGHVSGDGKPSDGPSETAFALIDTGAAESCIDSDLAAQLGLPVIDRQLIAGAGGASTHDVFLGHVAIPQLEIRQFGRFTGVNLAAGGQEHRVLLGRTFLQNVVMIYDGLRAQITIASQRLSD